MKYMRTDIYYIIQILFSTVKYPQNMLHEEAMMPLPFIFSLLFYTIENESQKFEYLKCLKLL